MMKKFSTTYSKEDRIEFIIDDDKHMGWTEKFDSVHFNRFFVVIDKNVNRLYGKFILEKLKKHNKQIFLFEVEPDEHSKSLAFYPKLIDFFESNKCNLSDLVIAVGGGVILDLVSFACSTYMRGLNFYAVPTTLIGQIDASTAGKTCLNTKKSKNLLGTFYYPLIAYNNINFLKTNNGYHQRQGFSEIFKYGLLGSPKLVRILLKYSDTNSKSLLLEMIELAMDIRIKVRKKNALASNLGHTFGHAIEKISNFKILHGDAISIGTIMSLYFSKEVGLITEESIEYIIDIMKRIGLNVYLEKDIDVGKLIDVMTRDKKSAGEYINLVLIEGIGKPYYDGSYPFYKTPVNKLRVFLRMFIKKYPFQMSNCGEFLKRDFIDY